MEENQGYAILKKDNPAVGKRMERKPSISRQMQEAGRQAQVTKGDGSLEHSPRAKPRPFSSMTAFKIA